MMRARVQNNSETGSFDKGPEDTGPRESPSRLRKKPPPIPIVPSSTVLSAEMSRTKTFFASLFAAKVLKVRVKRVRNWLLVLAIGYTFVIDDMRIALLSSKADTAVDVSLMICMGLFVLDMGGCILRRAEYMWSMYFFLDLLATAAILADLQFLVSTLYSPCTSGLLRAHKAIGKAARLGASSLRLLSYVRTRTHAKISALQSSKTEDVSPLLAEGQTSQLLPDNSNMQLIRGTPRKTPSIKRESTDTPARRYKKNSTLGRVYHMSEKQPTVRKNRKVNEQEEGSKIGKTLAEKVVMMVALIVLSITLMYAWITEGFSYSAARDNLQYGLKLLTDAQNKHTFPVFLESFLDYNADETALVYVVKLEIQERVIWGETPDNRSTDICSISYSSMDLTYLIFNLNRLFAAFSLCQTILLSLFTLSIVLYLNTDITNLLVFPLERMMRTVTSLVQNPLNLLKMRPESRKKITQQKECCGERKDFAHGEIRVLENAFRKIGVMLALVYGSAGSELITSCIKQEGNLTVLIRGREVLAVFGFVHIGHFDDLLARLRNKALRFINQIARLVHSQSEKYMGSVNRNLGDAFLLVWKLPEEEGVHVAGKFQVNAFSENVQQTTSLALLSMLKIISKVSRSNALSTYNMKYAEESLLTCGLHVGWAYEGPIGSQLKVDASYLSPNVNIASRVESVAKQYGVYVLVSEDFHIRLDCQVQPFLRHIDTVLLKGVELPMSLFSFDLHTIGLPFSQAQPTKRAIESKRKRLRDALDTKLVFIHELFTLSDEITYMRRFYTQDFFAAYSEALSRYFEGNWTEAAEILSTRCELDHSTDGPADNLLEYMHSYSLKAPMDWKGVRLLLYK